MKVWVLKMKDDEGGVAVKVFSTDSKAVTWVQSELDAEDEEETVSFVQEIFSDTISFMYHSEGLEVTFQLEEVEVDVV